MSGDTANRGARVTRFVALAIGTTTFALAGCGGGSKTSTPSTAATGTTGTTAAAPTAAQYNSEVGPLNRAMAAEAKRFAAACCAGKNYAAMATAIRTYQAALTTYLDAMAALTPPPAAAAATQNWLALMRTDIGHKAKLLAAVLTHDPAAIAVAEQADNVASARDTAATNAVRAALGQPLIPEQ